jgi:SnoaL-like polyketide cyclase
MNNKDVITHIDRVVNGKIVEHWGQGDQAGMMQQLGIVPIPGISLFYSALHHRFGFNK